MEELKIFDGYDYLIEVADEQFIIVSFDELEKMEEESIEYDGFTGFRIVGALRNIYLVVKRSFIHYYLYHTILFSVHFMVLVGSQRMDPIWTSKIFIFSLWVCVAGINL